MNFTSVSPVVSAAYVALANLSPNVGQEPDTSPDVLGGLRRDEHGRHHLRAGRLHRPHVERRRVQRAPRPGSVEFLVLPSSVFTQASGQVQFKASSSLVSVYVRSL